MLWSLDDALLAHVLSFCSARDVEAMATASRLIALHLLPAYPQIWRVQFARRWNELNFALDDMDEDATNLEVDWRLRQLFHMQCSESRMFHLLSRAIVPVPSGMDLEGTRASFGYSDILHSIVSREQHKNGEGSSVEVSTAFAFNGKLFGHDRSVRANLPFPNAFYLAVFKRKAYTRNGKHKFVYQIGATASGYFEIGIANSVSERDAHMMIRRGRVEMTAIGLVGTNFPLIGKQPGWTMPSFGYHGDNGKLYSAFPWKPFGPRFGVNDTVGCGVRSWTRNIGRRVFFTHNGNHVTSPHLRGNGRFIPCEADREWFPAVGLDSANTVHVNFGQYLFACDHVIDELFSECTGSGATLARKMLLSANNAHVHSVQRTCFDAFFSSVQRHRRTRTTSAA